MAKYEKTMTGEFEEVLKHLENDIGNSGMTMNLVDESDFTCFNLNISFSVSISLCSRNRSYSL